MMRYYGYYSNVVRGKRQQEGIDDAIPCFSIQISIDKQKQPPYTSIHRKQYIIKIKQIMCVTLRRKG